MTMYYVPKSAIRINSKGGIDCLLLHYVLCMLIKGKTRFGVDRVKPRNRVRINLGLGLRGPDIDIRPGLDNRHLIIECHRSL